MCKCSAPTGSATGTHVNFPPLCAQPPLSGWAAQVVAASRLGREDLPGLHAIFQHLDAGGCPAAAPICMHALAAVCAGYVSSAGMNGAASGQEQLPATCGRACFRFAAALQVPRGRPVLAIALPAWSHCNPHAPFSLPLATDKSGTLTAEELRVGLQRQGKSVTDVSRESRVVCGRRVVGRSLKSVGQPCAATLGVVIRLQGRQRFPLHLSSAQDELHQLVAAADVDGDGRVSGRLLVWGDAGDSGTTYPLSALPRKLFWDAIGRH